MLKHVLPQASTNGGSGLTMKLKMNLALVKVQDEKYSQIFFLNPSFILMIICADKALIREIKPYMPRGHPFFQETPATDMAPPTLNVSSCARMTYKVPTPLPSQESAVCPSAFPLEACAIWQTKADVI